MQNNSTSPQNNVNEPRLKHLEHKLERLENNLKNVQFKGNVLSLLVGIIYIISVYLPQHEIHQLYGDIAMLHDTLSSLRDSLYSLTGLTTEHTQRIVTMVEVMRKHGWKIP